MNEIKDSVSMDEAVYLRGFGTFKAKKESGKNWKKY